MHRPVNPMYKGVSSKATQFPSENTQTTNSHLVNLRDVKDAAPVQHCCSGRLDPSAQHDTVEIKTRKSLLRG